MATMAQRLAELEAQVAELGDALYDRGYQRGRESVLGRQAAPRPPRPRHLQPVEETTR